MLCEYMIGVIDSIVHVAVELIGKANETCKQNAGCRFECIDLLVHGRQFVAGSLLSPFDVCFAAFPGGVAELSQKQVALPIFLRKSGQIFRGVQWTVVKIENAFPRHLYEQGRVVEVALDDPNGKFFVQCEGFPVW